MKRTLGVASWTSPALSADKRERPSRVDRGVEVSKMVRLSVALALAGCAFGAVSGAWVRPVIPGGAVVTSDGFAPSTFDNDVAGSGNSVCEGACIGVFPPYLVSGDAQETEPFDRGVRPRLAPVRGPRIRMHATA